MNQRDLYSIIAGILPPLLGLGLIELYVERDVSFAAIATYMIALGAVMIVIAALVDAAKAAREHPRRSRRRSSKT